jgi:predicted ATPase
VGKTRLALQLAAGLVGRYAEGIWLAELAPLADPAGVPAAVAGAVGVCEALGDETFAAAWAAGQAMTPAEAMATALEDGAGG